MQFYDVGEYRILLESQIGKGRNSTIYNCIRQDNQGLYPLCARISIIQKEYVSHFERKIQELEEIRKMGNYNLQQIEKIFCSMTSGGTLQLIIIMEKYETSLKNQMNNRFNKSEQLKLVEDLQSGLKAFYCKKISHGDIRPENIYIKKLFNNIAYKLAYCQTSRILQSFASENQFFSIYMAPELFPVNDVARRQFMNESKQCSVGYSDIFSLGVILCQLIFGTPIIKEKYEQDEIRQFHDQLLNNQIKFQFNYDKIQQLITEMLKYSPSKRINFEKMCSEIEEIKRGECSQTQKTFLQFNQEQIRFMGTCLPNSKNIFGKNQQNLFQPQQGQIPQNFKQSQQFNQFKPHPQNFKPEFKQQQQINGQNQQNNNFQPDPQNVEQFKQQQPNFQAANQAQQQANIPQMNHQQNGQQPQQQQQFLNQIPQNILQIKIIPNQQEQFENRNFQQNILQNAQKASPQVNQQQQFQNQQNFNVQQQNENHLINQQEQFQNQEFQHLQNNKFQANMKNFNPQFSQQQQIQNPNLAHQLQQYPIPKDNYYEQQNDSQSIEKQALFHQPIIIFLENILNQSFQMMDKITFNQLEGALAYFQKDYVSSLTNNLEEYVKCLKECFTYQSSELTEDIYIEFQFSLIQLSNPGEQFQAKTIQEKRALLDKLYSRKNN